MDPVQPYTVSPVCMAKLKEPDTKSYNYRIRRNIENIAYLDDDSYFALLLETVSIRTTSAPSWWITVPVATFVTIFVYKDIYDCPIRKIIIGNGQSILCSSLELSRSIVVVQKGPVSN
jgi:hypothetical protein